MKKFLLSLLLLGSLIGVGFGIWHITEEVGARHTETIYPEVGFNEKTLISTHK